MKINICLYDNENGFSQEIDLEDLRHQEGIFARVEYSGCEGFYVEIGKLDYETQKAYRYAFVKYFDRENADTICDIINSALNPVIHNLPAWKEATECKPTA